MVGVARGTVQLAEHDPEWERLFEAEAERLHSALGERVITIEHVGSTAIEGVAAKPIIDLLVVVEELGDETVWTGRLGEHGYTLRPNDGVEDRLFYAKGPEDDRTHYLSVTDRGSDTHVDQLAFRDYLREHPETAREYSQLKRELAARFPDDRASYTERKSSFVEQIVEEARDK